MKLGETVDSINGYTYKVNLGSRQLLYPYVESAQLLTMVDGTQEFVNFGARVERRGELELVDVPRADYFALIEYLVLAKGSKVRFTLSNSGENPWGASSFVASDVFYASLVDFEDLGEEDFSVSGSLYSVRLVLSYTGTTVDAVPNVVDTSLLDVCIEIDTVRARHTAVNQAALPASPTAVNGDIGFTTSDRKVWVYGAAGWKFLYTLTADVAAYGLVNGVFYLSAFADITSGSAGAESKNWKSGLINKESIKFPSYHIDISKGPGVEKLEGFNFSLDNVAKFWTFVVANKITFYGATVKLKFFDRPNGQMVLLRTGTNYANSFNYTSYTFQIEPRILNESRSYPDKVIDRTNFPYSDASKRGQPVISTYGRWPKGELQVSNFTIKPQKFRNDRRFLGVTGYDGGNIEVRVDIDEAEFRSLLGIALLTDYPGPTPVRRLYLRIVKQDNQPDQGRSRRIESIVSVSTGVTGLRLKSAYAAVPTAGSVVEVTMSVVELIADDDKILGFTAPNYLREDSDTSDAIPKQLYARVNDEVKEVPSGIYQEVDPATNSRLTINTDSLDVDSFENITIRDSARLEHVRALKFASVLFGGSVASRSFDYGFLFGANSNLVEGDNTYRQVGFRSKTVCTPSVDRFTVSWTNPSGSYASQTLIRYKYHHFKSANDYKITEDRIWTGLPITQSVLVDDDVTLDPKKEYFYRVSFVGSGSTPTAPAEIIYLERNKLSAKDAEGPELRVREADYLVAECTLTWTRMLGQTEVGIYRNEILLATLTGGPGSTQTYYRIEYATHAIAVGTKVTGNKYQIKVRSSGTADAGSHWFMKDVNTTFGDMLQLKGTGETFATDKYLMVSESTPQREGRPQNINSIECGYVVKNFPANNANSLPAYGVVFNWLLRVDRSDGKLADLADAKDVRLLCNFVVGSWYGTNNQVPVFIQLRGVKKDRSTILLVQHTSSLAGLVLNDQTKGAFAAFLNMPKNLGGTDTHYDTENQASGSTPSDPGYGIYTGKDMWKLPDWLFADDAFEWNQIDYLMFSVTNAVAVPAAQVASNSGGYHLRIGPLGTPYGGAVPFSSVHKDTYLLEYTKTFDGGLDAPQFARIDGGALDDASGTYTGTANSLVERGPHMVNRIVHKMLGFKPTFIGNEMRSRLDWVMRFQTKESRDPQSMLARVAWNLWGCFIMTPTDELYFRTLDHEEPNVDVVFAFTPTNVIKGSISSPNMRRQNEIYQKFLAKYNFEPSVQRSGSEQQADSSRAKNPSYTEEMMVGWDLKQGQKVSGGFTRKVEDDDGVVTEQDVGDEDMLAELCRLSALLYTTGGQVNEFGTSVDQLFEMFYRPSKSSASGTDTVEVNLPNLTTLYGASVKPPKVSMQELFSKLVRFFVFNTWTFSLQCNMKYTIYYNGGDAAGNPAVNGLQSSSWSLTGGVLTPTADRKLKLMDRVTFRDEFYTNNETLDCFVVGVSPNYYRGTATITLFAFKPPGQLNIVHDPFWNAGYGPRNQAEYTFKDEGYGLSPTPNAGTFADAGFGSRTATDYDFPNGTYADAQGEGTGQN